ncbi:MAG: DUF4105 domain-containing protein [Hyphomonadaceae bacterium]|nr:DUF4105 domain-containing protein [Hyphomonadaceae bacterium]
MKPLLLGLLAALGVFIAAVLTKTPRHDRDWQPHLARTPGVDVDGAVWTVSPIRDWSYTQAGPAETRWLASARIDTDAVERVWLVLEPHPGLPVMAHTLVLFEFANGDLIGLTIEARKETNEKYAPLRGALNKFELIYVWATPRDLLTRRAVMLGHELELYPLDLSRAQARAFLTSVLDRTAAIAEQPRFYNTAVSNCTNELAKAADLAWDPAFILTGGAAKALHKRGIIAGESFEVAQARAQIAGWTVENVGLPHDSFNCELLTSVAATTDTPFCKSTDSQ